MSKYAVIKIKGTQYKVAEGEEILVDRLGEKEKPEAKVLLVSQDGNVKVGKPEVRGAKVTFKVLEPEVKGEKITVFKYKAKSRYRKKRGFRPVYTKLLVEKIS